MCKFLETRNKGKGVTMCVFVCARACVRERERERERVGEGMLHIVITIVIPIETCSTKTNLHYRSPSVRSLCVL
jgi:hypothetical protein